MAPILKQKYKPGEQTKRQKKKGDLIFLKTLLTKVNQKDVGHFHPVNKYFYQNFTNL